MKFIDGCELRSLLESEEEKVVLYLVENPFEHASRTRLSCMYIKTVDGEYYTSFTHGDHKQQSHEGLILRKSYTHDIKSLLHLGVSVHDSYDLGYDFDEIIKPCPTAARFLVMPGQGYPCINNVIPISSHLSTFRLSMAQFSDVLRRGDKMLGSGDSRSLYHTISPKIFYYMEKVGLCVDEKLFIDTFGEEKRNLIKDGAVMTSYNLYTATGRPSNAFGGVNYAALKKEGHQRECFISRWGSDGMLLNLDFSSYHLHLIADLLGYDLPDDVHREFGKIYFDTDELTPEQYDESKTISFRNLYAGKQISDHPFFIEVHNFRKEMWDLYCSNGVLRSKMGRIIPIRNPSENTVFNYFIQSLETEQNMVYLYEMMRHGLLPILYTYDSVVFDIKTDKLDGVVDTLKNICHHPFSIEIGSNLKNLVTLV